MNAPSPIPVPQSRLPRASPGAATAARRDEPPSLSELFIAFATISLSGFGGVLAWSRRMMVEERRWLTPEQFNETYALCSFLPGGNILNFSVILGARFRGARGAAVAAAGLIGPPLLLVLIIAGIYAHYGDAAGAAPRADRRRLGGGRIDDGDGRQDGAAAVSRERRDAAGDRARHLRRDRHRAVAAAAGAGGDRAGQHRARLGAAMNSGHGTLVTLAGFFGVLSLFAIGGGNSAVPEMHRFAVDVQHWLTDRQFADSFALAQLTPGPNIIIVTLIGYHVAGVLGALVTTLGDVRAAGVFAFFVGRASDRFQGETWHGVLSRALVPVTLGLTAASAAVIAATAGYNWMAIAITLGTALVAYFVRVHPLWMFAVAACSA